MSNVRMPRILKCLCLVFLFFFQNPEICQSEPRLRKGLSLVYGIPPGSNTVSGFYGAGLTLDGPRYRGKPRINLELATWLEFEETVTNHRIEENRRLYSFSLVALRRLEGLPVHFYIGFGSSVRLIYNTVFRRPPVNDDYQYVSKSIETDWLVSFFPSAGFAIPIAGFFRITGEFRLDWCLDDMARVKPVFLGGCHILFPAREPRTFFRSQ